MVCSIDTNLKEHQLHIHLEYTDKSVMVEWSFNLGHHIRLCHIIFSAKPRYMDHVIEEGIEIELTIWTGRTASAWAGHGPVFCSLKYLRKPSAFRSGFSAGRPCTLNLSDPLTWSLFLTCWFPAQHALTHFHLSFLQQQNCPFSGPSELLFLSPIGSPGARVKAE
jgi:hypothetical protein